MNGRLPMFLLGATLALGFAFSAYLISQALVRMRQDDTIRVKGYAEAPVVADAAVWRAFFHARAPELAAAFAAIERSRTTIDAFLKEQGVATTMITYGAVTTETEMRSDDKGNKTNSIEFYALSQYLEVTTSDVRLVDRLSKGITELIKAGVEVSSGRPSYTVSTIEKAKMDLLAKATRNAYERAEVLAENSNGRVGPLTSASQGVFQITPPTSTDVSDSGSYDTSTIDKKVRAVVTLEFRVAR